MVAIAPVRFHGNRNIPNKTDNYLIKSKRYVNTQNKTRLAVLHDIQYKDYQLSTSLIFTSAVTYLLQKLSKGA